MTISRSANGSIGIQTGENGFVPVVEPTPPVPPVVPSYFAFGLDNGTDPKLYGSVDLAAFSACGALPVGTTRVVYGNGVLVAFVLVDAYNVIYDLFQSGDFGTTWTQISNPASRHMVGLDFVNGYFMSLNSYDLSVWFSADGVNWNHTNSLAGNVPATVKFIYFKGVFCAISSPNDKSYFYTGTLVQGSTWAVTQIDDAGALFVPSDETIAVSDSYILAIRNDNTAWSSPDGTTWTQILSGFGTSLTRVCHIESKFWAFAYGNDGPNLSIPIEDTTLEQGNPIEGFLDSKVQILPIDTIVYGIGQSADYRIWQSPIPPTSPNWTTNSTGIPSTMQLKQLLG